MQTLVLERLDAHCAVCRLVLNQAVMQSNWLSSLSACRVTVRSRSAGNQQRRTEQSEGVFWSGAKVNTECNSAVKPGSAVAVAVAHFREGAIPRKIRRAVRRAWNAVAGPCTAEKGPDGVGTRNIARRQIPRTSRPTLNNTKVTPLVLRRGCAMSIAKAVPVKSCSEICPSTASCHVCSRSEESD